MQKTLSAALVSLPLHPGRKDLNLDVIEKILKQEADSNFDLFVFPELSIMGGFEVDDNQYYFDQAEEVPTGQSCIRIASMAKAFDTAICAGIVEKDNFSLYITHFIVSPDGYLGKQRKLFAQNPESDKPFSSGHELTPIEFSGYRCSILACADFLLPEASILAGLAETSIILAPTDCFYENKYEQVLNLLRTRALDCSSYALACFGHDVKQENTKFLSCAAIDSNGKILVQKLRESTETTVTKVEIKPYTKKIHWGGPKARVQALLDQFAQYAT